MKPVLIKLIVASTLFTITGCVSSSINESIALIQQEDNMNSASNVNTHILKKIEALRTNKVIQEKNYTFSYQIHNDELNSEDKIAITKIIINKNHHINIEIAPATGANKIEQLTLSLRRAKILNDYISNFNDKVTISFAPNLTKDTINLITGV